MSLDPVRIQVGIRLKKRANVTYAFLRGVVAYWADGGRLPRGIEIVYIRWINPVRANSSLAVWKDSRDRDQSLEGARETLRGLLRTIHLEFNFPEEGPPKVKPIIVKKPLRKAPPARKKPRKNKLRNVRRGKGVRKK